MIPAVTQRVLSFLAEAGSYAHHPSQVRMVQTHASWVFIASPFVYKIKKPVSLGFLDFSTLELRHADCKREVTLNRRLADDVYLGVEPICELGGSLRFGREGTIVEWAVKMRKMDERCFLKELIRAGKAGATEMERIVEKLRRFYDGQPPLPPGEIESANDRLQHNAEDNFASARAFIGKSLSQQVFDAIAFYTREFFTQQKALLASRIADGWIRDCHGDLHLDHIHLTPDEVHIYDCIEFNVDFRHIDVACDIAFLAMDLDFNGRPELASFLVGRFAKVLQDEGIVRLMDFYKCYRACVRGKVESLHAESETVAPDERQTCLKLARRYFQLALQYAIAGSPPCVFVFMGKVASGKSALAEALAQETGWSMHSSDRIRKTCAGTPLNHRGSAAERAALYAPAMTAKTYAKLMEQASAAVRLGQNVILDATFSKRAQRDALKRCLASQCGDIVWIEAAASDAVIRERLVERDHDDHVVSDARLEDYRRLSSGYEAPDELGPAEKIRIHTDGDLGQVFASLMKRLASRRAVFRPVTLPDQRGMIPLAR